MLLPDVIHDLPIRKVVIRVLGVAILHETPGVLRCSGMVVAIFLPHTLVMCLAETAFVPVFLVFLLTSEPVPAILASLAKGSDGRARTEVAGETFFFAVGIVGAHASLVSGSVSWPVVDVGWATIRSQRCECDGPLGR